MKLLVSKINYLQIPASVAGWGCEAAGAIGIGGAGRALFFDMVKPGCRLHAESCGFGLQPAVAVVSVQDGWLAGTAAPHPYPGNRNPAEGF